MVSILEKLRDAGEIKFEDFDKSISHQEFKNMEIARIKESIFIIKAEHKIIYNFFCEILESLILEIAMDKVKLDSRFTEYFKRVISTIYVDKDHSALTFRSAKEVTDEDDRMVHDFIDDYKILHKGNLEYFE